MEFKRKHTLLNKLIVVDGTGKCGKSLMLDILSCFQGVEKQEYNSFLEYIPLAYKYKKITKDMAIAILQTEIDTELYNNMIGRYTNTRLSDDTSVYRYHSPGKYLKRSLEEDGPIICEKVLAEKPIYICWSHDLINKSDIVFEAYGNKLEWIYINRRPIDIIYEWDKKQYSQRMSQDPTDMQYNLQYKNTTAPEIASGWEDEFLNISPHERTVKMIYTYFKLNRDALQKKKQYKNLHVFNFENLVTDPYREIERLKNITGNEILPAFDTILAKAKCPRILDKKTFLERESDVIKNISSRYADLLSEMHAMYEDINKLSAINSDSIETV
ncbi:MAG: hypothetical protein ACD_46C00322G0002 [uncultured bacterium]|nr:MAG: hypothetical protein ACD_46C00322G0002 [uncultured bacterium]